MGGNLADELTEISDALPDYEVERELGRGGMGVVLLGKHRRLGRAVAIKELPQTFATEPDIRERFTTEARTLATLSHPHIVPVYDYVERGPLCLIVMEQLPGGTVWERFTTVGLTAPAACAIVLACCAALQHAHEKGVLHLDVKPDNLMFDGGGTVKVTDFGISRVISGDRLLATVDGQVLGTPAYMSPEQARGGSLTPASDVYSSGVMLYELLTGHLPWTGAASASELLLQRLEEAPRPLREIAPHVPPAIADVVMRSLERDREKRYKSAEEFGLAIASACADSWGPAWLDHAGVLLIGSERLSIAARTTRGGSPRATTDAPSQAVQTGSTPAPETMHSGEVVAPDGAAPQTIAQGAAVAGVAAAADLDAAAATPVAPAEEFDPFKVVRAAEAEPRIEGADLNQLQRADLVDLRGALQAPPFPKVALAITAVCFIAAVIFGAVASGPTRSSGNVPKGQVRIAGADVTTANPLKVDFSKNIPISVATTGIGHFANQATLKITSVGIPLGKVSTDLVSGNGVFAPNVVQHLAAGNVRAELQLQGGNKTIVSQRFEVQSSNKWYTAAIGVVGIALVLAGLANLESNLRRLRRRTRVMSLVGAGIAGALVAAGLMGVLTASAHFWPTLPAVIGVLALTAGGFAFGAYTLGVVARRRRVNRALRRAVKNLGVKVG